LRSQEYAIDIINTITAMRHDLLVDLLIHARFEVTNPDTIPILKPMLEQGLIQLVSVMDHTPGQGQYKNVKKYVEFMTRWLGFDPHDVGEKTISQVEYSIETNAAQPRNWDIVRDITETALAYNIPVASHDDDTVEKVQKLASLGVTISEFPVTLVAAEEARRHGMHVIMGSPNAYRGASTSGNLGARDAIKANVADILATDYFPAAMFHSMLLLHKQEGLPLYESANLITQNPAAAMRLNDRGRIAPGLRADLVVFDDTDYPRIHATLRQGTPIYWDMRMAKLVREQNFRFPANYAGDSIEVEPVAEESVS
jgi:alpha-D-ribose 1-methylphosphonate 5-triphosphate diphosphatase